MTQPATPDSPATEAVGPGLRAVRSELQQAAETAEDSRVELRQTARAYRRQRRHLWRVSGRRLRQLATRLEIRPRRSWFQPLPRIPRRRLPRTLERLRAEIESGIRRVRAQLKGLPTVSWRARSLRLRILFWRLWWRLRTPAFVLLVGSLLWWLYQNGAFDALFSVP